jgi:hypothetical protein
MQASLPQLSHILEGTPANVVEIYSCPAFFDDVAHVCTIDTSWPGIPDTFSRENPQEEMQYYHRDLCYAFDVGNDAQRCFRRTLTNEMYYRNFYITALHEESIPSHRFPSTQDISATVHVVRHVQRINNRMTWVYERDEHGGWTSYIRYQHAPNVDLETMQKDLASTLSRMPRPVKK